MTRDLYFDFDGDPIDYEMWSALFTHWARLVARTVLDGVEVSTVWIGLDYALGRGAPLIYETMVFGGPLSERIERYPNRVAALAGHDRMICAVRDAETGKTRHERNC
jgi:hypothetical protein